jgi:hypothetical protein
MRDIVIAIILAIFAAPFGHWAFVNRKNLLLSARCLLLLRRRWIRVSCAALLRVSDDSGQYLLARTRLRRDVFGPFGGAFKYAPAAAKEFDKIGFEPQVVHRRTGTGIERDLRGFLRGASLPAFLRWFRSAADRENDSECLTREMREEFVEIDAPNLALLVQNLEFNLIREVIEPPAPTHNENHWQMRILRVCDLDTKNPDGKALRDALMREAGVNPNLTLVGAEEIRLGRSQQQGDRGVLGHHAGYLFTADRVRPDEVAF